MKAFKIVIAYCLARLLGLIPYATSSQLEKLGLNSVLCGYIFIIMTVFILFTVFFMSIYIVTD